MKTSICNVKPLVAFYRKTLMQCLRTALLTLCTGLLLGGCSREDMPAQSEDKPGQEGQTDIPLIILDTDIGAATDDLFALEMLYNYERQGRCRLLGVIVDREGEDCAATADVMNTYWGRGDLPIGVERDGIKHSKVFTDYLSLHLVTDEQGHPLFRRSVGDYSALPDGWRLYRQLLAAQPDGSVSICSVGFVTTLNHLLKSGPDEFSPLSGVELVRRKVKSLYIMGGAFGDSKEPEYNFGQGMDFALDFFRLWPDDVSIQFSSNDVGDGISYLQQQVLDDLAWTDDRHPVKYIYSHYYHDDGGQRMWDVMPVIQAVEGDHLFAFSPWGTVTLTPNMETLFVPSATGHHRYQLPGDAAWNAAMLERIRTANRTAPPAVAFDASKYALIDLHLHLDGSLSIDDAILMAAMSGVEIPTDRSQLVRKLIQQGEVKDLNEYLAIFDFAVSLMQTEDAISYSVKSLVKRLDKQGLIYAEIRFAPQKHRERGLSQEEVVQAAIRGLNDGLAESRNGIKAQLMLCCMRDDDNQQENMKTIDLADKYLGKGVCGADLAGAEALYSTNLFRDIFAHAQALGVPFSIHAGEADGVESMLAAIEMGARRIGHGVRSYKDAAMKALLKEKDIHLTVCPTSNLQTHAIEGVSSMADYPLPVWLKEGVSVSVNTDNMKVSNTTVSRELQLLYDARVITARDAETMVYSAISHAFASDELKAELTARARRIMSR